ncbi:MAG TPA: hypothetical protein VFQ35_25135, partial [Polyangiaceae bacterium]|nr:hypothetical protein [Polyangiaceae bacterium]
DGRLIGYIGRSDRALTTFLTEEEPLRSRELTALTEALRDEVRPGRRAALLIATIDKTAAASSPLASAFVERGFTPSAAGLSLRRAARHLDPMEESEDAE